MKIVGADVIVCCPGRNFVTLKITTDEGVTGLGDATLNGRELSAVLEARWPGLRTLYMSGYSGNALDRHGMLEAGVQLLQKPFSKQELAAALRLVLDQPAAPSHSGTNPALPG